MSLTVGAGGVVECTSFRCGSVNGDPCVCDPTRSPPEPLTRSPSPTWTPGGRPGPVPLSCRVGWPATSELLLERGCWRQAFACTRARLWACRVPRTPPVGSGQTAPPLRLSGSLLRPLLACRHVSCSRWRFWNALSSSVRAGGRPPWGAQPSEAPHLTHRFDLSWGSSAHDSGLLLTCSPDVGTQRCPGY